MSIGLAIFAKTPGVSPVKTRLAVTIGQELAEEFYKLSIKATASLGKALKKAVPEIEIYWAVAEEECLNFDFWKDFKTLPQGNGMLGERLSFVYDQLLRKHQTVCFIGSDSPHLDSVELSKHIMDLNNDCQHKFMIGETSDGGFYFFGGRSPISKKVWSSVEYSSATTCFELCDRLKFFGPISFMKKDFDIDYLADLLKYKKSDFSIKDLLPEQTALINWVKIKF
jgi:glycosyltransferase A (GT-A) superfamily protein (DUF2064 family)